MKKRYILLIVFAALVVFGCFLSYTQPALPVIQLPGECYPGTATGSDFFPCLTNTLVTTFIAFAIVLIIGLSLRARSRTADEVPTGFYNFFEWIFESALNFATNLAGTKKALEFFGLFFTLILYILVSNWIELVPGVDSIGFFEWVPHLEAVKAVEAEESLAEELGTSLSEEERKQYTDELFILGEPYCRQCGYCLPCPGEMNIPAILRMERTCDFFGLKEWVRVEEIGKLEVHPERCEGCGVCEPRCPFDLPIRQMIQNAQHYRQP